MNAIFSRFFETVVMPRLPSLHSILHSERGRSWGLCGLSAVLYAVASPRPHVHAACWVLLIPLLAALETAGQRKAFWKGWFTGTWMHLLCFYWVVGTVQRYSNLDLPLSLLTWVLFSLYSGLAFALMSMCYVWLRGVRLLPGFLVLVISYTAMEYLFPFIFPWHLGAGQYGILPVIQIADLFGIYGLTALTVLVNHALWDLIQFTRRRRSFPLLSLSVALLAVLATLAYGVVRMREVREAMRSAPEIEVGMVQANVLIEERRSRLLQQDIWQRYVRLSRQAVEAGADLIVWPESAVRFAYRSGDGEHSPSGFLRRIVRVLGRPLLFGSWAVEDNGPRNTAYLLGAEGELEGRYDKVHLLAFGEYMPLSRWIPQLKGLVQGVGDFRAGEVTNPLCTDGACFGVLICYEAILTGISSEFVNKGAEFLVNITNDVWFGDTSCPEQHLMLASFRSVENRVWLVRNANTGISAFVDPLGKILGRTPVLEQAVRTATIQRLQIPSLYRRWGDWFPRSCVVVLVLSILAAAAGRLRDRRRSRKGEHRRAHHSETR